MHQYKLLESEGSGYLGAAVTGALAEGWELWGNPFAIVYPSSDVTHFCQAVVKFDPAGHTVVGTLETALRVPDAGLQMAQEPAGYSVGVPETPEAQAGPTARDLLELHQMIASRPILRFMPASAYTEEV